MFKNSRRKRKNEAIKFIKNEADYNDLKMLEELMDKRMENIKKPGLFGKLFRNLITLAGIAAVALFDRRRYQDEEDDQLEAVYYYDKEGQLVTIKYE